MVQDFSGSALIFIGGFSAGLLVAKVATGKIIQNLEEEVELLDIKYKSSAKKEKDFEKKTKELEEININGSVEIARMQALCTKQALQLKQIKNIV